MKVAYLLGSLNRGGTETLLYDLLKRYKEVPYEMLCVHRKGGAYQEEYYQTGVPMYCISPRKGRYVSYIRKLRTLFLREQVTHVHAQQFLDGIYARLACVGTGIQVIETFHGYDFEAGRLGRMMIRQSICWADKVCFVSECEKNYYLRKYHLQDNTAKYFVVYNGVNFEKLDIAPSNSPLGENEFLPILPTKNRPLKREKESVSHTEYQPLKLAMVGNFVSGRSQSSLRQFLLDLHNAGVAYDFYFVGKKNEQEPWRYNECVQFCEEHGLDEVHFLGARSDVPSILRQLDAFVYATDHDTFGIAVIEAIAAGVPTFVNDWEVMTEITQDGRLATLYKTGDTQDLFGKFMHFVEHREECKIQAEECAKQVRRLYSIESHVVRLKEVYNQQYI